MSERIQQTSAKLSQQMSNRYDDGLHHKHNKDHRTYRKHEKTHPNNTPNHLNELDLHENIPEELLREFKLRKIHTRAWGGRAR